ncbi:MAG: hypothetical protein IKN46_01595 [Acholeplasmatales bacterium]|nr:hypothetical protein [Acholeplasmatales bacterium]
MAEEEKVVTGTVDDNTQDYLAAIKELKENSVDRSEYDKLKAENKKLIDAVVNGQPGDVESKPQLREPNEIREELFNHEHNNLDYVKLALELRSSLIAEGKPDPFLPMGSQIAPTADDVEKAEKVAQVYQECIDYADGDSKLFTQELMRRTNTSVFDRVGKK